MIKRKFIEHGNYTSKNNILFACIVVLILYSPTLASTSYANLYALPIFLIIIFYFLYFGIERRTLPFFISMAIFSAIGLCYAVFDPINYFEYLKWIFRLIILHLIGAYFFQSFSKVGVDFLKSLLFGYVWISFLLYLVTLIDKNFSLYVFYLFYSAAGDQDSIGFMESRPGLFAGNPNALALVMCFVSVIFFLGKENLKNRVTLVILSFIILVSLSRTGILVFASMLIFLMKFKGRLTAIMSAGMISLVILSLAINFQIVDVDGLVYRFTDGFNLAGRDELWFSILNSPRSDFEIIFGSFIIPVDIGIIDSEYINIYLRYGILGFILSFGVCMLLLYFLGRNALKKANSNYAICAFALIVGFLIASISASPLTALKLSFAFVMILSCLFSILSRKIL